MDQSIVLATVVEATPAHVFDVLSTSNGLAAIWTADCDVGPRRARFGFAHSPRDVEVDVTTERDRMVRMRVTSDHPPFCKDSTWEWELREIAASPASTGVLFRHYGFADGYPEFDLRGGRKRGRSSSNACLGTSRRASRSRFSLWSLRPTARGSGDSGRASESVALRVSVARAGRWR